MNNQKGSAKILFIVFLVAILAGIIYMATRTDSEVEDQMMEKSEDAMMMEAETAELLAIGEYQGSGSATRSFKDSVFTHTVTAGISDPAEGKFYEGWLVKKTAGVVTNFFSTGEMVKEGDSYTLNFTSDQNYPDHNDVVITEETESLGLDGNPEDHVLEGTF